MGKTNSQSKRSKTPITSAQLTALTHVMFNATQQNGVIRNAPLVEHDLTTATLGALAQTSRANHLFAKPLLEKHAVIQLCQYAANGNPEGAKKILKTNPALLLQTAQVKTFSGKQLTGTAFECALMESDDDMAAMLTTYFKQLPNGDEEKAKQFNHVFPEGLKAHVEKQRQATYDFQMLVDIISECSDADIKAALNKEDNNSLLSETLKQFRQAFDTLSNSEKIFNPEHLLKAMTIYHAQFYNWYDRNPQNSSWDRPSVFLRQVYGYVLRHVPACYAQAMAQGLYNVAAEKEPLQRDFKFHNEAPNRPIVYFPLDSDPAYRLGFDFAASGGVVGWGRGSPCLKTYVEQKRQTWRTYAAEFAIENGNMRDLLR